MENTTNTQTTLRKESPLLWDSTEARVRSEMHNVFWALDIHVQPNEYNTPLKDMGVDSLEIVELCLSIEKHFKVIVSDKELAVMATFNDAVELVTKKLIA